MQLFVAVFIFLQELKSSADDARHRVDDLVGLSQTMLSVVKDSPTKSGVRQKLQRLQSSLQHIDSELGLSVYSVLVMHTAFGSVQFSSEIYQRACPLLVMGLFL